MCVSRAESRGCRTYSDWQDPLATADAGLAPFLHKHPGVETPCCAHGSLLGPLGLRWQKSSITKKPRSQSAFQRSLTHLLELVVLRPAAPPCAAQVDQSRRICDAVAGGELDVAIVGGEVPPELRPSLRVATYAEDQLVRPVPACDELCPRSLLTPYGESASL